MSETRTMSKVIVFDLADGRISVPGLIKKTLIALLTFFPLFCSGTIRGQDAANSRELLSFKLSAGIGYAAIGDIDRHIKAFDEYMAESLAFYDGGRMRGIGHIVPDFEAELRIRIKSHFAFALGTGYFSGSRKDDFQTAGRFPLFMFDASDALYEFVLEPQIRAFPLELGLYYSRSLAPRIDLVVSGGPGLYFSRISLIKRNDIQYLNENTIPEMPYVISQYDVRGTSLGFHGGAGLEYRLTRAVFLVVGVQGRYASVRKLSGTREYGFFNYLSAGPQGGTEKGTLYVGTRDMTAEGYGENCPDLLVTPSQAMKRATLDLSGISLRVGVRIKLF